jgi:hypothetical protein
MKTLAISIVGLLCLVVMLLAQAPRQIAAAQAQTRKPLMITHLYTGPDGQTHADEFEAKFNEKNVAMLMQFKGAELHRAKAGAVDDWHNAPRRQYVITLSGRAELEVAGGKKIPVGPGNIDLVEDTTGKGHITRVLEDRVTLQLPLTDQSARAQ